MPEEPKYPQPGDFNTPTQILSWIRKKIREVRESGLTPVAVTLPMWAECMLASMKREEIGDEALVIIRNGVRGSFVTFYGVPTQWEAQNLDVTTSQ